MRHEKQLLLDEINGKIDRHGSFLIISHSRLTANSSNGFRREIARIGGDIEFVRKRVLIKAAQQAGISLDLDTLPGHIGLVFAGPDPLETTKATFKFSQQSDKAVEVVGGRFEGQLYNAADMEKLSKLPGMNEMRAQFLSTLEAPMAQTLAVMDALLASVVYCLDNKCKQESSEK